MVERQISPLSKLTREIILPFSTLGSHLSSQNQTVDEDVENQNFQVAEKILGEVWNDSMIEGHPVIASYINLPEQPRQQIVKEISKKWIAQHMRQSKYMVQTVKCGKDSRFNFFQASFLAAPIRLSQSEGSLCVHCVLTLMHLNPFSTNVPLLYPLKTEGFLMFSGDIEVEHWLKLG